ELRWIQRVLSATRGRQGFSGFSRLPAQTTVATQDRSRQRKSDQTTISTRLRCALGDSLHSEASVDLRAPRPYDTVPSGSLSRVLPALLIRYSVSSLDRKSTRLNSSHLVI